MRVDQRLAETIARAALANPYRQVDVLHTRAFASWLNARQVSIDWQTIHLLWRVGIVRPLAVLEGCVTDVPSTADRFVAVDLGFGAPTYVDLGVQLAPEAPLATNFHLGGRLGDLLFWHPFQLWEFFRLQQLIAVNLSVSNILRGVESCSTTIEIATAGLRDRLAEFADGDHHAAFQRILGLLLLAEPIVHTDIDPHVRTLPSAGESFDGYYDWRAAQRAERFLHCVGLSVEDVQAWHNNLAVTAQLADPVQAFRVLLRHADHDARERLKGDALLAHTLYNSAEVLRRYVETYHGRTLPEEDDIIHGPRGPAVKEQLYGATRTTDFDRRVFRQIVRSFDLDPQARMLWFVEGDTEEAFIRLLAERTHVDLLRAGVDLMNLKGLGGLKSDRFQALLERLQREEVFPYVTADREQRDEHVRLIRNYARNGLLPAGFRIWDPDFEAANFTVQELVAVANIVADRGGVATTMTEDMVTVEMQRRRWPIGRTIKHLWGRATFPGGKGRLWGEALADWVADHDAPSEIADENGLRPVDQVLRLLLRGQSSHYRFTAEDMDVDPCGTVVPRAGPQ